MCPFDPFDGNIGHVPLRTDCPLTGSDCTFTGSTSELLATARNVSLRAADVSLLSAFDVGGEAAGLEASDALLQLELDASAALALSYDVTTELCAPAPSQLTEREGLMCVPGQIHPATTVVEV